jgi:N-acyl-phosphatidylethanolamine-hydrolysing phospholipase D
MVNRCRLCLLAAGLVACASPAPPPLEANARPAHHTADGHFQNTDTLGGILRDTVRADSLVSTKRTEVYALPVVRGNEDAWQDSLQGTATWIGHSTYYLRLRGVGVLTDPIFSSRSSPVPFFGPKRGTPPGRALDSLPSVDLVLISHDHYDHLDKSSIKRIHKRYPAAVFAAPLRVGGILRDWGIPAAQVLELDWWQEARWQGLRLLCVPAHHTSRRGAFQSSRNRTLWAGWVLQQGERKMWFAGDMGMGNGDYYRAIAEREAPFDLVLLPIGSYLPGRYTSQHISPRQAVQLHRQMRSRFSLPMHWGDFGMTYEQLEDPPRDLGRALADQGVDAARFPVPRHGEIVPLDW